MRRDAVGIWTCKTKNCRITVAGGAWTLTTAAGASVRSAIRRLRENKEM
jgi:large subunit ribosomal protein L37Ae